MFFAFHSGGTYIILTKKSFEEAAVT